MPIRIKGSINAVVDSLGCRLIVQVALHQSEHLGDLVGIQELSFLISAGATDYRSRGIRHPLHVDASIRIGLIDCYISFEERFDV